MGVTISQRQAEMAKGLHTQVETADLLDEGWFTSSQAANRRFDLTYAIESLIHLQDHRQFARNLAMVCNPGSRLIVIDDFKTKISTRAPGYKKIEALQNRFIEHWHAYGYSHISQFSRDLASQGFILREKVDLTPYMKPTKVFNRCAAGLSALLRFFSISNPWAQNIIGGNGLKLLQDAGASGYYLLDFEYLGDSDAAAGTGIG